MKKDTTNDAAILATIKAPGKEVEEKRFRSQKDLLRYLWNRNVFLPDNTPKIRSQEKYKQAAVKALFPWVPIVDEVEDQYTDKEFFDELCQESFLSIIPYVESDQAIEAEFCKNAKDQGLEYDLATLYNSHI